MGSVTDETRMVETHICDRDLQEDLYVISGISGA